MPLEQKKIDALRLKVNFKFKKDGKTPETDTNGKVIERTREEKLKEISALDPKETIPYIISILEQVAVILSKQNDENLKPTKDFIIFAKTYLLDIDKKQNAGFFEKTDIVKEIAKNPGKIIEDIKKFEERVRSLQVTESTLALWRDTGLWLEGWYLHTYDMYIKQYPLVNGKMDMRPDPKNANAFIFKTIDMEDTVFYKATNACKMEVAEYYHRIGTAVQESIKAYEKKVEESKKIIVSPSAPQTETIISEGKKEANQTPENSVPLSINFQEMVKVTTSQGKTIIVIETPEISKDLHARILGALQHVLSPDYDETLEQDLTDQEEIDEETLAQTLHRLKDESEDVKLKMFRWIIETKSLSPIQTELIAKCTPTLLSELAGYRNSGWTTINVPFWGEVPVLKWIPAYHGAYAQELIDTIKAPNQDMTMKTPSQVLIIAFDAINDLKKDQSRTLNPLLTKHIMDVFDLLRTQKPKQEDKPLQQISKRTSQSVSVTKTSGTTFNHAPHLQVIGKSPSQTNLPTNQNIPKQQ